MFKLMQYFIKETLIAFYIIEDKYFVQKQIIKKNEILSKEEFEFSEEEFLEFIKISFLENTQTYVSTIIDTFNQGCVDSCSHSRYKEIGIKIENIKILCLKNYSIFIGMYELNQFQKEMQKFKVDFVFSPFLFLSMKNKKIKNTLYVLYTKNFMALLIYEDEDKPKYSNLYKFEIEVVDENLSEDDNEEIEEDIEDIEDIDDIEDIEEIESLDDIDESIDEDTELESEDLESLSEDILEKDDNIKEEMINLKNEIDALDFIKNSIKDYYENYSDRFLEQGYVFYNDNVSNKFFKNIEEETFLELKEEKINILDSINNLALKELNV